MGMGEFVKEQWRKQGIGWPGVIARGDSLIVPLGGWDATSSVSACGVEGHASMVAITTRRHTARGRNRNIG